MSSELHIFGQLTGFQQIDQTSYFSNSHFFLNYQLIFGDNWSLISGKQYSVTASSNGIWSEPLDWHFALNSIQNWPKIKFVVYKENLSLLNNIKSFKFDSLEGQSTPYAQGTCYLPTEPGRQIVFVKLTAPRSSNFWYLKDNLISEITGLTSKENNLKLEKYFENSEDNFELELEPKLTIKLELYVLNRFFKKFGVELIFFLINETLIADDSTENTSNKSIEESYKDIFLNKTSFNETRYCGCDLTEYHCDLNCCCDLDCDINFRRLFSKCINASNNLKLLNSKYCYNQNFIFKNNSNFILQKTFNFPSLFCIYIDNTKQQTYFKDKKIIKDVKSFDELNIKPEFNWTSESSHQVDLSEPKTINKNQLVSYYKIDNNVYEINNLVNFNRENLEVITNWKLPFNFFSKTGQCNGQKDIKYLKNFKSSCYFWINNINEFCKKNTKFDFLSFLKTFLSNGFGLKNKNVLNSELNLNASNENFCETFNCTKIKVISLAKKIYFNQNTCYNMVKKIDYKIIYNEKNGIINASVFFEYSNLNFINESKPIKFWQSFKVNFIHEKFLNKTFKIRKFSGNIEYNFEKPILGKYYLKDNDQVLAVPFNFTDLQSYSIDNECSLENSIEKPILFGVHHRSGCMLNIDNLIETSKKELDLLNEETNNENLCDDLNNFIFDLFKRKNSNLTFLNEIATYGSSNLTLNEHWMPLIKKRNQLDLKKTKNLNNFIKSCKLLKQVNYIFIYTFVGDIQEPQKKLISSVQSQNFQFVDINLSKNFFKNKLLELSTSIQFYNLKAEKRFEVASSPAFKIELPEDFFYPFVSQSNSLSLSYSFTYISCFLSLIFFYIH